MIISEHSLMSVFFSSEKWKTNELTLDEVFRGIVMFLEAAMLEPQTQVCGAVVIFDIN